MPPQEARLGFVYSAPYRIQGVSVAGEQAVVHVPEFDLAFDIGLCPRPVLAAPTVALSHAHMDHVAGLPYWFSQRFFQQMPGTARCLVHSAMAEPLRRMMASWVDLERQRTPHEIVPIEPDGEFALETANGRLMHPPEVPKPVPSAAPGLRAPGTGSGPVPSEADGDAPRHSPAAPPAPAAAPGAPPAASTPPAPTKPDADG
jgi:ribonuclease Z